MAKENPSWGAPRIHGEILKLAFDVSERTISRYLPKREPDEDKVAKWKAFLKNHMDGIAAMDFFTVSTVLFRQLYGFFIISHKRRQIIRFAATFNPTVRTSYRSPWQNAVAERWVGSCRRELLDHVILFGDLHLYRLFKSYVSHCNEDRCYYYSLCKDAPEHRPIQKRPEGKAKVISLPRVGGLHHRYEWRRAA